MFQKCEYVPVLETKRLIMREPVPDDAGDLKEWFGLEEVYLYWGNPPGKGERNPEMLFVDPRPNVKRKPYKGFIWAVVEKESDKVIGLMEVFDIQNDRMGTVGYRVAPRVWGRGYCTGRRGKVDVIKESLKAISEATTGDGILKMNLSKPHNRHYSPKNIEYPTPYVDVRLEESYKNAHGLDCDLTFWAVQLINEVACGNP